MLMVFLIGPREILFIQNAEIREKKEEEALKRKIDGSQVLNIAELATIWHLPSESENLNSLGHCGLSEPQTICRCPQYSRRKKKNKFLCKTLSSITVNFWHKRRRPLETSDRRKRNR
jgi:hypothetical protein